MPSRQEQGRIFRICGFFQRAIQTRYSFTTRLAPVFDRRPSSRTANIWPCSRCAVIESSRCACSAPTPAISRRILKIRSPRSEEHTSELQSRQYLVCRLLLEKKNKKEYQNA